MEIGYFNRDDSMVLLLNYVESSGFHFRLSVINQKELIHEHKRNEHISNKIGNY